jgi:hypothetical protein
MTRHPLPDTPRQKVLMNVALGDHQVTNFAADVEARTIGAHAHVPILDPGRWPGVDVLWHGAADREISVRLVGGLLLGHRPGPPGSGQPRPHDRRAAAPARERAQPGGRRPA